MNEKIELDVSFRTRDYWRYYVDYYFSFSSIFFLYLSLTVFGFCVAFLLLGKDLKIPQFVQVSLVAVLFICVLNSLMLYLSVENAKKVGNENCKYIFSDEKVEIIAKSFKSQLDWHYISSVKETTNYFVLSPKDSQNFLIPKRCFQNYEQTIIFKNLLHTKFGEKVILKKSKENLGLK
jgi:hypothetical protein